MVPTVLDTVGFYPGGGSYLTAGVGTSLRRKRPADYERTIFSMSPFGTDGGGDGGGRPNLRVCVSVCE